MSQGLVLFQDGCKLSKMSKKIITLLAHSITFLLACISNVMECHYKDCGCYTFVRTLKQVSMSGNSIHNFVHDTEEKLNFKNNPVFLH